MIRKYEELAINAWPSLQTYIYDGWVIRFADGYTKRANSINPLYQSLENIEEKIEYCEGLFKDRNLPVVFKLTEESKPVELDIILERKAYKQVDLTSFQGLDLTEITMEDNNCVIESQFSSDWLKSFSKLSKLNKNQENTLGKMLDNSIVDNYYFKVIKNNRTIACGLGVQERDYFGLFDIIVAEEYRGKGYGTSLINSMLGFAKENAAKTAYLQVVINNKPANKLYSKIGFKELYKYWYQHILAK